MEIHILTEFHLKITMIGDDIAKKVTLPQILPMTKIVKLERILNFYDLKHGNTSTGRVSVQNYSNWMKLLPKR